jgi:hypothetical protein
MVDVVHFRTQNGVIDGCTKLITDYTTLNFDMMSCNFAKSIKRVVVERIYNILV